MIKNKLFKLDLQNFAAYDPTNITLPQGFGVTDVSPDAGTSVANIPLSVVEAQVKEVLKSNALGVYVAATREQGELIPGGIAVYRIPELIQVQNYDTSGNPSTGPASGYFPPATYTKKVSIDKDKIARYEFETLTMAKVSNTMSGESLKNAIIGRITGGVALAILAQVDADFLSYVATNKDNTITIDMDITTGTSTVQSNAFKNVALPIADAVNDLENVVDQRKIGVNREKVFVICQNKVRTRLIAAQNSYDNSQAVSQAENSLIREQIAGVNVITHPFFDRVITKAQSFDRDNAYTFTNMVGVIMHTEAVALPFALSPGTATTTINPNNGNPVYIFKYSYGIGKIRTGLITQILKKVPTPATPESDVTPIKK